MKRILAVLHARNLEFFRDRSTLGWNFLFPFLVVVGFGYMFNSGDGALYKVAEVQVEAPNPLRKNFRATRFLEFVQYQDREEALEKLSHHKVDFVVQFEEPVKYWVSESSPKSYVVEKMLQATLYQSADAAGEATTAQNVFERNSVQGQEVRYVDWLMAGMLGMNIMFSSLFGVGYVIVRYRKNGVLKRLKATPLRPWEFLSAQIFSRLLLNIIVAAIVLLGCKFAVDYLMLGSYFDLFVVLTLGTMSLISVGMLVAARFQSEELAGGLLNLLSWPMMFLSGVWFSLEGAHPFVQSLAQVFPLTHMIHGLRSIMTEGATLSQLLPELSFMAMATVICVTVSSYIFKWE